MTIFSLVYSWETTTRHDALMPNVTEEDNLNVASYLQHTEVAPRLAWVRNKA